MTKKQWIFSFLAGVAISLTMAHAHHSLSGVYDMEKQITVEGVVTEFQFVNPHPFVAMTVQDGNGKALPWKLEMDNRYELDEIGVKSNTFKKGDRIVVSGNPGHTQKEVLYVLRLDRPADGLLYEQIGSTPRIRFSSR